MAATLSHVIPNGSAFSSALYGGAHSLPQPIAATPTSVGSPAGTPPSVIGLPRVMTATEANRFRRQRATGRERKRAGNIRTAFSALADCLPNTSGKRLSRLDILQAAAGYIETLHGSLEMEASVTLAKRDQKTIPLAPVAMATSPAKGASRDQAPSQAASLLVAGSASGDNSGNFQQVPQVQTRTNTPLYLDLEDGLGCVPLSDSSEVMSLDDLEMDLNELLSDSGISSGESASPIAPFLYENDMYWNI